MRPKARPPRDALYDADRSDDGRYREPVEGTPFGRYQLIELLGRGGMGEVWRAYDTTIDRMVALKMLLPHFAQDPIFEKRFRREARVAARHHRTNRIGPE
jgi:serine/threonine protein kinase